MTLTPSKEQARHFALMLNAGMPAIDAIGYFLPEDELLADEAPKVLARWLKSPLVQSAIVTLQGAPWQSMTPEARVKFAIDKHYNELAYFLYSHNYAEISGADKLKADTCRSVLEAKLAGTSGKLNAIDAFYADLLAGKIKLQGPGSKLALGSV